MNRCNGNSVDLPPECPETPKLDTPFSSVETERATSSSSVYGVLSISSTTCSTISGLLEVNPVRPADITLLVDGKNGESYGSQSSSIRLDSSNTIIPPQHDLAEGSMSEVAASLRKINNPSSSSAACQKGPENNGSHLTFDFARSLIGHSEVSQTTGCSSSNAPEETVELQFVKKESARKIMNEASRLTCGSSRVPPHPKTYAAVMKQREMHPVCRYKYPIVKAVYGYQVTLICAESGCGKSSQVPQYILEAASIINKKIRVICVVPYWTQAVTLSHKVATERGECIGSTVGYQVRLEGRASPLDTVLTYCSSEALVRTLVSDFGILKATTHIILDELQEQDALTEVLMHCLREAIVGLPHLHLVLMTAPTGSLRRLYQYFGGEMRFVNIQHTFSGMKIIYLENIIEMTKYDGANSVSMGHSDTSACERAKDDTDRDRSNGITSDNLEPIDLRLVARLLRELHLKEPQSASILVFLADYDELIKLKELILYDSKYKLESNSFVVYLLHTNTQIGDHEALFKQSQYRKIILATSLAESCLTFRDVAIVIDSGRVYQKWFNKGIATTKVAWITKDSANQRLGKLPYGKCFRLYTKEQHCQMPIHRIPEITIMPLSHLSLFIRSMVVKEKRVENVFRELLHPPSESNVTYAIRAMTMLGALDENEMLTDLGLHLLDLAVDPNLGKAILYSVAFRCLDPVVTLVSAMSYRNSELSSQTLSGKGSNGTARHFAHTNSYSDHLEILRSFQEWEKIVEPIYKGTKQYRPEDYISLARFELIYGFRTEILGQLRASGFLRVKGLGDVKDLNVNSDNWALVKAILFAAVSHNVVRIDRRTESLMAGNLTGPIKFHPSCTILDQSTRLQAYPMYWIMYDELMQKSEDFNVIRGCTAVNAITVALFSGKIGDVKPHVVRLPDYLREAFRSDGTLPSDISICESEFVYKVNQWLGLVGSSSVIQLILQFRIKISVLITKHLKRPGTLFTPSDENLIRTLLLALTCEDHILEIEPVKGVGSWPRFAGGNLLFHEFQ